MSLIIIAAVILVIACCVFEAGVKNRVPTPAGFPYQKTGALFSPAERSFLAFFIKRSGKMPPYSEKSEWLMLWSRETGLNRSARQSAFNRISGKHFDFLLCDKEELSVICAIELDDRSHHSKRRHERDEFLNGVCEAAGVPLIQVPAKSGYVIDEVKRLIAPHLTAIDTPRPGAASGPPRIGNQREGLSKMFGIHGEARCQERNSCGRGILGL